MRNDASVLLAGEGAELPARRPLRRRRRPSWSTTTPLVDHAVPHGRAASATRASSAAARAASSAAASWCGRTRRRPTRSSRTRTCCSATGAEVDTKPQLEIHADDVKCSHGSSDRPARRRTRSSTCARAGLGEAAARDLLMRAFAPEVLRELPVAARWPTGSTTLLREQMRCARSGGGRHELRRRARPQGLPDPRHAERARQAARLPRQRRQRAEAARGDRRDAALLRDRLRERAPRRLRALASAPPRPSKRRAPSVARFLGAAEPREIVFVRDTTEAINLVAHWDRRAPRSGPATRSLITEMEHHSNIVPWQMLCERARRASCAWSPIDDRGELRLDELRRAARPAHAAARGRARLERARHREPDARDRRGSRTQRGVPVLVDGAQAVPHLRVDVQALGCDFYAFSGHKLFGPTGIGVLYGRAEAARGDAALPGRRRHDRARSASRRPPTRASRTSSRRARPTSPARSASAPRSTTSTGVGLDAIAAHEQRAAALRDRALSRVPGPAPDRHRARQGGGDLVRARRRAPARRRHDPRPQGIAVRTGHHCAQPLMERFGVPATVRASFALYNTRADVDALVRGLGAACARSSPDVGAARALPVGDPRPQQAPRNLRRPAGANRTAEGHNPLCGDQLTVYLERRRTTW